MPWKDLPLKDRSMVVAAWLQASATIGMFVIALVGIWQVTPIITYQIEQQVQARRTAVAPAATTATGRFVAEAFSWWSAQVTSYRRIVELTAVPVPQGVKVSYQLVSGGGQELVAGMRPDLLVVTATTATGAKEILSVPVNENAMTPSQYLQCKVNQGYFADLEPVQRQRVEIALARYLREYMLPKAPVAFVRPGMSLRQLHTEVSLHQDQRELALQHIQALGSVLDKASTSD